MIWLRAKRQAGLFRSAMRHGCRSNFPPCRSVSILPHFCCCWFPASTPPRFSALTPICSDAAISNSRPHAIFRSARFGGCAKKTRLACLPRALPWRRSLPFQASTCSRRCSGPHSWCVSPETSCGGPERCRTRPRVKSERSDHGGAGELPGFAVTVEIGRHHGLERFGRDTKAAQGPPFGLCLRRDDIVPSQEFHLVGRYRKNLRKKTEGQFADNCGNEGERPRTPERDRDEPAAAPGHRQDERNDPPERRDFRPAPFVA